MTTTWRMVRPGHHCEAESGMHVVRALEDDETYWQVWTAAPDHGGVPWGRRQATVQDAKRHATA